MANYASKVMKIQRLIYYLLFAFVILWACTPTRLDAPSQPDVQSPTSIFTELPEEAVIATEHGMQTQNALTQIALPTLTPFPTLTPIPPYAHLPTLTPIPNSTPVGIGAFVDLSSDVLGNKYEIQNAYYFDTLEGRERYEVYAGALAGFGDVDTAQGVAVVRIMRVTEQDNHPSVEVIATNEFFTTNREYNLFPVGPVRISDSSILEDENGHLLLVSITQGFSWIFIPREGYMLNNSVPPRATLEVGGQKQLAGLGSYCWINSCADGPAISTSSVPLLVQSSLLAHLRLPLLEPPDKLYLSTMWVSPPGQPLYEEFHKDEERATWYFNKPVVELGELPLRREQDIKLSLKPGFNVLIIIAVWEDYGDASYGFFIDMRE